MSTIRGFFKDIGDAISPPPQELGARLLHALREGWVGEKYTMPRVEKLLEQGADVTVCDNEGFTALTSAIVLNNPALVGMILKKNPPLEVVDKKYGWTPLMAAVVRGHIKSTQLLLDAGCDPGTMDPRGQTATDHAKKHRADTVGCDECIGLIQAAFGKRRVAARLAEERRRELAETRQREFEAYLKNGMPTLQSVRVRKPLKIRKMVPGGGR